MDVADWVSTDMRWLFTDEGRALYGWRSRAFPWSEEEDDVIAKHHPNYARITELLPTRSKDACRTRARKLGLVSSRRFWSDEEDRWLRKNYETASWEDIQKYLPKRSKSAVIVRAFSMRLRRERRQPPPVGVYIIDEIRARARELNFSMRDLDEEAGTVSRFQQMRAKAPPIMLRILAIEAVVKAMGGRIEIRWSDE